ncbi:lytic transglycosylase [Streptomyces sp. NPDC000410]|uniref:lytic transglycosylase domain-containing protein n=1 Tax=Streptomyces sp. NPDC000410 TaxID=3154254 RepID=UPI003328A35D
MAAQFGRRLRRGATTTAVAAAAVAALSASQAPGVTPAVAGGDGQTAGEATPPPGSASGDSSYYTDLPPLNTPNKPGTSIDLPATTPGTPEAGIPATVLAAYKQAEQSLASSDPACRLPWQLLAAIGKVESSQARGGRVDAGGTTLSPILGPVLNGVGFANISDTDDGAYDGDTTHDRAVGPMQFIPSTWAGWGQDANHDGRKDPNNIYDAALAAGKYLCAGQRDLSVQSDLDRAILSYNQSREYLRTVMSWFDYYKRGTHEVPDGTGVLPRDRSDSGAGAGSTPTAPVTPGPTPPTTPAPKPTPPPKTPPSKPDGGTETPKPPTTPDPLPVETVTRIEDADSGKLTATAGTQFAEPIRVRAENRAGAGVSGVPLVFEIVGDTDTRFAEGRTSVVVPTRVGGIAVAPALKAGEKTGTFTIRVSVDGRALPPLAYAGTVTPRQADTLARTGDKEQTAAPGAEFAEQVEVKATLKGAVAAGVAVTATMITSADDPAENTKGPYFKDADGKPVRTLTELRTDAEGKLVLPKIFADDQTGTFLLRLTTEGGATLAVELQVAAPAPAA